MPSQRESRAELEKRASQEISNFNAMNERRLIQPPAFNSAQAVMGVERKPSISCSSGECSINEEEVADEIADEEDNAKSVGYSSGMSLFALPKHNSSSNNNN